MSILVKNGAGKWEKASEAEFSNEVELQELLYASPELIEREDAGPVVFVKEASLPGSGNTDLIGVASNGDILIIETKLAKNSEIRRKVIGQILEYAAFLWGMTYTDLDRLFVARERKPLIELLAARMPEFDQEGFQSTVSENLAAGRFDLLIAVDEINEELERIITYVSSRGGGFKLEALAIKVHTLGQVQVLVPQRWGQLSQPESCGPTARRKLTLDDVLASLPDDEIRELVRLAIHEWKEMGHEVDPGTRGVSCKSEVGGKPQPFFWIIPEGGIWSMEPLFGAVIRRGAPADVVAHYRNTVSVIDGFRKERCLSGDRPPTPLVELSRESIMKFLNATNELVIAWRASV